MKRHQWSSYFAALGMIFAGVIGIAMVGAVVLAFATSVVVHGKHPTDADLKERFGEKKSEFEQIVAMLRADTTMTRIAPDFCKATGHVDASFQHWIEDPRISDERWNEYRAAFRRIGASAGVAASSDRASVQFLMSTKGLSIGGSAKGIAFSKTVPRSLVENLDRPERPGKAGVSYVRIEDHWYIFYDWTN